MKPHPHEFSFDTIMDRADSTAEIHVVCRVENYAKSVGFDEPCRFREVTIIRTEYRGAPLTQDEMDELHSRAVDQLCHH
jgi:hypothetical protein